MSFRPARRYATVEESQAARRATNQRSYQKRRERIRRYNAKFYGVNMVPVKVDSRESKAPAPVVAVHPSVHLPLKGSIAMSLFHGLRRKVA